MEHKTIIWFGGYMNINSLSHKMYKILSGVSRMK